MRLLQDNPDLTQRELAKELGVSVGGLNYCLKALMEKGLVKVQNFSQSKNKFGYVYILTPHGIAEKAALTSRFLKRKMEEYASLEAEIQALKEEINDKVRSGQRMETMVDAGEPLQLATHRGLPSHAQALAWNVFFQSRGRGIDLLTHYPWVDDTASITSIVVETGAGNEKAAVAALVLKQESLPDGRNIGLVGLVCVSPEFRGRQLSSRLLSAAAEVARNKSLDALVLWTNKPDVYINHGFAVDSEDRYVMVSSRAEDGIARTFRPDPAGIEATDRSDRGVPAFATRVLVFDSGDASITVLPAMQGYTLADWTGDWEAVFQLIERVLPDRWNLNAPAGSTIFDALGKRGYRQESAPGPLRMIHALSGQRATDLPYIPLLNRI